MSIIPNAYLRNERLASAQYEEKAMIGLTRSRAAIEVARNAIKAAVDSAIERSDEMVNCEVAHVGTAEQKCRAFLTDADRAVLTDTIMQAMDDHYFLPLDLLSREAGEE